MKKFLCFVFLFALVISNRYYVQSAPWNEEKISNLTQAADVILCGTIENIHSEWNEPKTIIYSYIDITPNRFIKNVPEGKVTLKLLGGRVGETASVALGFPRFVENEEVLLFLKSGKGNPYHWIIGPSEGKFDIVTELGTMRKVVTHSSTNMKGTSPESMDLESFISLIQRNK